MFFVRPRFLLGESMLSPIVAAALDLQKKKIHYEFNPSKKVLLN